MGQVYSNPIEITTGNPSFTPICDVQDPSNCSAICSNKGADGIAHGFQTIWTHTQHIYSHIHNQCIQI
jgi:hypothetical protein